ncbi:hypothetical protein IE53DRAFT_207473 [Violaceomyces palustris]|uniref:Uncharacterized protein n=1 Tax=Violaceomyces palustris TaxID=1673888 RepID=A0ACD0NR88_9BASI|nr:hypothetical protein IE53DRAFT_207473 [Violaceomyces palustris]
MNDDKETAKRKTETGAGIRNEGTAGTGRKARGVEQRGASHREVKFGITRENSIRIVSQTHELSPPSLPLSLSSRRARVPKSPWSGFRRKDFENPPLQKKRGKDMKMKTRGIETTRPNPASDLTKAKGSDVFKKGSPRSPCPATRADHLFHTQLGLGSLILVIVPSGPALVSPKLTNTQVGQRERERERERGREGATKDDNDSNLSGPASLQTTQPNPQGIVTSTKCKVGCGLISRNVRLALPPLVIPFLCGGYEPCDSGLAVRGRARALSSPVQVTRSPCS